MMKRTVERFLLLLASSSFTTRQLREFANWVLEVDATVLEETIRKLKEAVERVPIDQEEGLLRKSSWNDKLPTSQNGPSKQIIRLLRKEAGLSAGKASEILRKEVLNEYGFTKVPKLGKDSFENWVKRVSKKVPYSILLHIATRIRNEIAHMPKRDWPLRSGR